MRSPNGPRCPRTLADDILRLHTRDPQLVPGSNLRFALPPALNASVYQDDALGFAVPAWTAKLDLPRMTRSEADALFENCEPVGEDFTPRKIDVTVGFLTECLHMCPNVLMAIREVMNSCVVVGYELPKGIWLDNAQTAPHGMEDVFPGPITFDIGRYLPPRSEQRGPGYSPQGLGTHTSLGSPWTDLQLAVNVPVIAHDFGLEMLPANDKLRFSPLPSKKPSRKPKFRIAVQKREMPF